mgnify:CR=1 FL=1
MPITPMAGAGGRESLETQLAHIERLNPRVNAVVTLDADHAREQACAQQSRGHGPDSGRPLAGSFITVKDAFETAGMRTTCGAPQWASHVPARNADAVQRLVDAGAVVFGKTNVPIYAADLQSYNRLFGVTVNPWDATRTCGGSSGGAAAAVACGMTPFELGSDIGGSIRIPAHFCGVYGHNPSFACVPFRGHIPPPPGELAAPDMAVAGPLARSADTLEQVLRVLAGAQRSRLPATLGQCRAGVWMDDTDFPLDRPVRLALDEAMRRLAAAGARLEPVRPAPVLGEIFDCYLRLLWPVTTAHLSARAMRRVQEAGAARADDSWHAKLARYATASHHQWLAADEARARLRARFAELFEAFDVLLMPVAPVTAFPHDHGEDLMGRTILVNGEARWYWEQLAWIAPASAAYLPATVAPVGLASDGLPVGIQIVGPQYGDLTTIDYARRMAEVLDGFRAPPAD